MKYFTTLALCKKHKACADGYKKLADALGGTRKYGANTPIPLVKILETNGIADAIWALRTLTNCDREIRLFACDCAERVLSIFEVRYPGDDRPRRAIETARKYADGQATQNELSDALEAARYAVRAALDAARDVALAAAWAAVWPALDAAWHAAWAANVACALDAARYAGGYAGREWQAELFREVFGEVTK